jgi:hypothetical protein
MTHWRRPALWIAFGCALELGACASTAAPVIARTTTTCFLPRARAAMAQPIRAHDWVKLAVQLQLGRAGVYALRDCTGRAIRWQPAAAPSCKEASPDREPPLPVPIGQDSVIERSLGSDRYLVWIVSHRFANGDGFGPLALARRVANGLQVDALGSLRLRTARVNLELWTLRQEAVVVASGESCGGRIGEAVCRRAVRLLLHRTRALLEPTLVDGSGRCVQESPLELSRQHEQTLATGLRRSFELDAVLQRDPRYIVVEERLLVRDTDPSAPQLPPREVQRIEAKRFILVQDGRLISRQHPLWQRALNAIRGPPKIVAR